MQISRGKQNQSMTVRVTTGELVSAFKRRVEELHYAIPEDFAVEIIFDNYFLKVREGEDPMRTEREEEPEDEKFEP